MSIRTARVAEEIQKVLGERLVRGLRDPLPGFVTIRSVEVTSDFAHAKIFVSVFGSDAQKLGAIEGLKSQKGSLRKEVGDKIRLRQTPDLQFILDESAERAARVHALLDEARVRDAAAAKASSERAANEANGVPSASGGVSPPPERPVATKSAVVEAQHGIASASAATRLSADIDSGAARSAVAVGADPARAAVAIPAAKKPPNYEKSTSKAAAKQAASKKTASKKKMASKKTSTNTATTKTATTKTATTKKTPAAKAGKNGTN